MRIFEDKATLKEMQLFEDVSRARIDGFYNALASQKKMIDLLLNHFNLEPVTIVVTEGNGTPTKTTKLQKRKAVKPAKYNEGEEDDD